MTSRIPAAEAQPAAPQASFDERKGVITVKGAGGSIYTLKFEGGGTDKATLDKMKMVWQDLSQQLQDDPQLTMRNIQRAAKDSKQTVSNRASKNPQDPYLYKCEYNPTTKTVEFFRKRQSALQDTTISWVPRSLEKRAAHAGQSALQPARPTLSLDVHRVSRSSSSSSSSSSSQASSSSSSSSSSVPSSSSSSSSVTRSPAYVPTEKEARLQEELKRIEEEFDALIKAKEGELLAIGNLLEQVDKRLVDFKDGQVVEIKGQLRDYGQQLLEHIRILKGYDDKIQGAYPNIENPCSSLIAQGQSALERLNRLETKLTQLDKRG